MSQAFAQALRRALAIDAVSMRDARTFDVTLDGVRTVVELRSPWVAGDAPPRLAFPTIAVDGFTLAIRGATRGYRVRTDHENPRYVAAARDAVGFALYHHESNDAPLAETWLDVPARTALVHAVTAALTKRGLDTVDVMLSGLAVDLEDDRFLITPGFPDDPYLATAVRAGVSLATRPIRLAAELRTSLGAIGARLDGDAWTLDGGCVAVFERGAATVQLDWRRRLDQEWLRRVHLRTRLRAHGPDAPASIDDAWLRPRLDAHAPLVKAARAASITAARGVVTLLWDGLVRTSPQLAPALELMCRLVAPLPSASPLR